MRTLSILGLMALLCTGCATITNDPMQPVQFVAPACGGVKLDCSASNKRGSWQFAPPETVMIRRSDDLLKIRCEAGDEFYFQDIPSRMGGKIVASAVMIDFGITDAITDKHREYPAQIVLTACMGVEEAAAVEKAAQDEAEAAAAAKAEE